jgi:hypothetical protein
MHSQTGLWLLIRAHLALVDDFRWPHQWVLGSFTPYSSSPMASSAQYGIPSPAGDDIPTLRFFQIERSAGPSE